MAKPVGGSVVIHAGGNQLSVKGSVTSNIGQTETRETIIGLDGVHGHTSKKLAPFIQVNVTERPEFPLSEINRLDDVTVTMQLANGDSLVLSNAWHVGEAELNPEEGELTLRFEGMKGERMPA